VSPLRIKCVESLRRLGAHPRVLPLTALLLRGLTVRRFGAFTLREALGRRGAFVYRLRENDLLVAVRHGSGDVVTLGEVFHDRQYEPPGELEQALSSVQRVLDLGANVGLFGAFAAARWPQAEIVAFEPDPANASLHERTIELNALGARWRLVRAAAGASAASAEFVAGGAALAHLADPLEDEGASPGAGQRRIEVEVHDVLELVAGADLLKLDVEGGEWAILGDPRFRTSPPHAVVLEYHPRFCPGADPRAAAEQALIAAGLRVRPLWHREDGHGMLWGWRA
jgi:FkbM family methyltransferase